PVLSVQVHDIAEMVEELGARRGRVLHHEIGHLSLQGVSVVAGVARSLEDELPAPLNGLHFLVGQDLTEVHAERWRARRVWQIVKEMVVVPRLMIDVATQHAIVGKSESSVATASNTHRRTLLF